jgi:transcriptional regulator with XRE-family HTH domain
VDAETAQRLDGILPALYLAELRRLASEAIKTLRQHTSQRKLELRIGLSQGYLSRLLTDDSNPSPALVLLLGQLAKDPASRLPEIDRFWGGTPPAQDPQPIPRRTRTKVRKSPPFNHPPSGAAQS